MTNSLLLISERPEDKVFATEVATVAGLTLQIKADPREAAEVINADSPAIILADANSESQYQLLETAIQEKVGLFSEKINSNAIHFLSSRNLENVQYLIQSPLFGSFVLRNYGDPKSAGQHYGRIVKASLLERAFGLANLLKPQAKIQVVRLKKSSQKQEAAEAIKNYLLAARFHGRTAIVIANAVDELLMNAIFDAPVDSLGKPIHATTARSTEFELEGKSAVEMHVGFDGQYVGISVVDCFGSLDKSKLLSHISKIYTDDEYKVKTSVAGAGIGLATVFRTGGSFFFVSESRTKTEVTVLFKRLESFREFKDQFRFISTQFYF